jgi:hypothetical protein
MDKLSMGSHIKEIAQKIFERMTNEGEYLSHEDIMKEYLGIKKNSSELERIYAKRRSQNILGSVRRMAWKQEKRKIVAIMDELLKYEEEIKKKKYETMVDAIEDYKFITKDLEINRHSSMKFGMIQSDLQAIASIVTRDAFIKGNIMTRDQVVDDVNTNVDLPKGNKIKRIGEIPTLLLIK